MMGDALCERVSNELLPYVRQPGQYIGSEVNQLVRPGDWQRAEVKVVVAFPDTYTIGTSHLGCQILYWLCNRTPGVCAERTYAPWIDAEGIMRARRIPLFTWDTRQPVADADLLAISLQYELCATTVLNMLDLAGIPLHAAERTDRHPLVVVGGPQADNPEPMADFVDLVVIGDGEHSLAAVLDACRQYKREGVPRREMIPLMAKRFPWIYAPNLYECRYSPDGTIFGLVPKVDGLPLRIERCRTPDFEDAPFPTRPLVPWVEAVHDRISIEIMRGCPQLCRFCHAGYTKRPLHYRSADRVLELAEQAYWATGNNEIGLLSLSTADYPPLPELAARLNARFADRMVNLSFPSLRIDKMLRHIPAMANSVRKGGITVAVEAARDDMRRAIRKKVTDGNLMDGVRAAYEAGWRRVKLYFMAGFPGEREQDVNGIWDLSVAVSNERKRLGKPPARVTASVGWLVPKPFTPFQWMAQPRKEYFEEIRRQLIALAKGQTRTMSLVAMTSAPPDAGPGSRSEAARRAARASEPEARARAGSAPDMSWANPNHEGERAAPTPDSAISDPDSEQSRDPGTDVRNPVVPEAFAGAETVSARSAARQRRQNRNVRLQMHNVETSILEAVIARGDRRLGAVIYEAWKRGARLDGWTEAFDPQIWQEAFEATGIDPAWYAHRERGLDEVLPWDHIGLRVGRAFLETGYRDVLERMGPERPPTVVRSQT